MAKVQSIENKNKSIYSFALGHGKEGPRELDDKFEPDY